MESATERSDCLIGGGGEMGCASGKEIRNELRGAGDGALIPDNSFSAFGTVFSSLPDLSEVINA